MKRQELRQQAHEVAIGREGAYNHHFQKTFNCSKQKQTSLLEQFLFLVSSADYRKLVVTHTHTHTGRFGGDGMATSVHRIQAETERAQQKGEGSSPEGSRTKRNSLPETDLDAHCFVQTQISHSPSVNQFPSLAPKLPHSFREKYLQIKTELKPCIGSELLIP